MKKVSLLAALSVSILMVACKGSTGSVSTDTVNIDADMAASSESSVAMMDDSSTPAMMDGDDSSVMSADASAMSDSSSSVSSL